MTITEKRRKAASKPSAQRVAIVAAIKAHESELRERGVTSLDLFGSRTRGNERPDSDLDVLITYDVERRFTLYDWSRSDGFSRARQVLMCTSQPETPSGLIGCTSF